MPNSKLMNDQGVRAAQAAQGVVELTQWFRKNGELSSNKQQLGENKSSSLHDSISKCSNRWNSHVMTVTHDVALFNELGRSNECSLRSPDKIRRYVGGLPDMIHGNIVASKPKTMQEAIEMATELMDKRVSTIAEDKADKRRGRFENTSARQS
ncbi:hypothetical protein Tco_0573146 [Tanacetum coccineum]